MASRKELRNRVRREIQAGRFVDASRTLTDARRKGMPVHQIIDLSRELDRALARATEAAGIGTQSGQRPAGG